MRNGLVAAPHKLPMHYCFGGIRDAQARFRSPAVQAWPLWPVHVRARSVVIGVEMFFYITQKNLSQRICGRHSNRVYHKVRVKFPVQEPGNGGGY